MDDPFDIVLIDAIKSSEAADTYFDWIERTVWHAQKNPTVVAKVTADQFLTGEFEVMAGVKDAIHLPEGYDLDIDALHEGHLFDE